MWTPAHTHLRRHYYLSSDTLRQRNRSTPHPVEDLTTFATNGFSVSPCTAIEKTTTT